MYKDYKIQPGDSLSKIAQNNNLSVNDIYVPNKDKIKDVNTIFAGQVIALPIGAKDTSIHATKVQANKKSEPVQAKSKYGHLLYKEAEASTLCTLSTHKNIKGNKDAVNILEKMFDDAKKDGINFDVFSGFRSVENQNHLFYDKANERKQSPQQRAKNSAPPGYSEHHTGYAFDINKKGSAKTLHRPEFDKTDEYKWLQKNAVKYGFEMSFPKDNVQGISYEPWHWRYVGDSTSKKVFEAAHALIKK